MARRSPSKNGRDLVRKAEMDRLRYLRNKEEHQRRNREYWESVRGRAVAMWHSSRRTAKDRGLEHTLTKDWFKERLGGRVCEITGLEFDFTSGRSAYGPSIDRIDSSKGYTPENSRIILWSLNCAFHTWGEDVFQSIAQEWLERRFMADKEVP